jgi:hypothetical protein
MPSCFYSTQLARYREDLLQVFLALPLTRDGLPDYYRFKSSKASFNFPRYKRQDRRFSYLNPISFFFLSKVLADNYVKLRSVNRRSLLSVTPSIFDWPGRRSLTSPLFEARDTQYSSPSARFRTNSGSGHPRVLSLSIYAYNCLGNSWQVCREKESKKLYSLRQCH